MSVPSLCVLAAKEALRFVCKNDNELEYYLDYLRFLVETRRLSSAAAFSRVYHLAAYGEVVSADAFVPEIAGCPDVE